MRVSSWRLAVCGLAGALSLGLGGCKSNSASAPAPIVDGTATANGSDPADVNLANPAVASTASGQTYSGQTYSGQTYSGQTYSGQTSAGKPAQVLDQRNEAPPPQTSGEQYSDPSANRQDQAQYSAAADQAYQQDQAAVDLGEEALYADQPPPPLPEYEQPELAQPGYIWTPGYWSYATGGYYWVPGAWVAPPTVGYLWTPGYWGWMGNRYRFHYGFWGPHIGFYGGINYGFGYTGVGYHGGYWNHDHFFYNTQVNRVNVTVVRNVYVHPVTVINVNHISFNGPRGIQARPTVAEVAVYHEQVIPPMHVQLQHAEAAAGDRQQFFAQNHGRPETAVVTHQIAADPGRPTALPRAPALAIRAAEPARPGEAPRPVEAGHPGMNPPGRAVPAGAPHEAPQPRPEQARPEQARPEAPHPQPAGPQPRPAQPPQMNGRPEVAQPQRAPVQHPPATPENRPAPQPENRPAPEARPAPAPRPAPEERAAPQPPARPAPQPQAHPAPAAHPQTPSHPAPPPRPEGKPPVSLR